MLPPPPKPEVRYWVQVGHCNSIIYEYSHCSEFATKLIKQITGQQFGLSFKLYKYVDFISFKY